MFGALIAGALLAAQAPSPPLLVPGIGPAIACLDRFYASAGIDAAARKYVVASFMAGQRNASLPAAAEECLALAPPGGGPTVRIYATWPLVIRGVAALVPSESVDLAQLDRLAESPEVARALGMPFAESEVELMRLVKAAGIPERMERPAALYVGSRRFVPFLYAVTHPPAQPARRIAGEFTSSDYPREARRQRLEGGVSLLFTISTTGRVRGCEVVISTGHSILDEKSCAVLTARYVFDPARDEAGRVVEQRAGVEILWRMP